ncbi:MAG: UDP-glucose/GDP-mannose dehydrogenase family protein [Candidatus Marinimicrobia bacterium]|nr:UDP-glucose/GDP-mannose dehydrogenase family protein [Candidatus Neomarinimicrobiota bacterium]MBT6981761.1 UDP-glucose/GDP-mannose dehydrogenase family protein [Candidatus Neomarinimicrobiota bacterium]MBT7520451.1 UDP-glucose/GDP-mannose dehydrogenase family protein [Candidatus Neomarinimicrobiota bacterium]
MKKITVIGTGYVGLVSGAGISDFGHHVTCADIIESKIRLLKNGEIPIYEPGLHELVDRNVNAGRLSFTTKVDEAIQQADVIFIAVGTPQSDNGEANISAVESVAKSIGKNLNSYKVICTKSTVPIGTGNIICELIRENMVDGGEFDYVSNPEFLREGSAVKDFLWPDRVVIGASSTKAFNIMQDVYRPLYVNEKPILHTNVATAEMIKYAANAFLALKISYINEVANLCEAVGADVHLVAKGMGQDGRISPKFLHPGPGFGGSCFPKDTQAFATLSRKKGVPMNTIDAAITTNNIQKTRMVEKLKNLIGSDFSGKTIGILGLAFKPNTDDVRESSSIEMIQSILDEGGKVKAYDPIANKSMQNIFTDLNYLHSWEEACDGVDAMVIMTEWNEFRGMNLKKLKKVMKTPLVLDTRNILSMDKLSEYGFQFDNVGRKTVL